MILNELLREPSTSLLCKQTFLMSAQFGLFPAGAGVGQTSRQAGEMFPRLTWAWPTMEWVTAMLLDLLSSTPKDVPVVIFLTLILMFLAYLFSVFFCVQLGPDCNFNLLWHGEPFALDSNVECSSGMSHTEPTNFNSIYCYGHCAFSLYLRRYDLFTPSAGCVLKHACTYTRFYNNLSRSSVSLLSGGANAYWSDGTLFTPKGH